MIVYVSIGNSDDNLSQAEWSQFYRDVNLLLRANAHVHGQWVSEPASAWQNACWCVEFEPDAEVVVADGTTLSRREHIRARLRLLAGQYRQDSIAWAVAETEFLTPEER